MKSDAHFFKNVSLHYSSPVQKLWKFFHRHHRRYPRVRLGYRPCSLQGSKQGILDRSINDIVLLLPEGMLLRFSAMIFGQCRSRQRGMWRAPPPAYAQVILLL